MRATSTPLTSLLVLSQSLVVSAALFVAGCGGADKGQTATIDAPAVAAPAATEPSAVVEAAPAVAEPEGQKNERHAYGPFAVIEKLDLRDEQRAKLDVIREQLDQRLDAGRREGRQLATLLADGIESGKVDDDAVRARRTAVLSGIVDARKAFCDAANAVHATLDADQRAELVFTLRARRDEHAAREAANDTREGHAEHHGNVASELRLSPEQKRSLHDGVRAIVDAVFPDQKERRERMKADRIAAEDAFMTDSFDAHRYSFGVDTTRWMQTATVGATALSDLATSVLSDEQRALLAGKIRDHAR